MTFTIRAKDLEHPEGIRDALLEFLALLRASGEVWDSPQRARESVIESVEVFITELVPKR